MHASAVDFAAIAARSAVSYAALELRTSRFFFAQRSAFAGSPPSASQKFAACSA